MGLDADFAPSHLQITASCSRVFALRPNGKSKWLEGNIKSDIALARHHTP